MSISPKPSTSQETKSVVAKRSHSNNKIISTGDDRTIKLIKKPRIVLDEDDFTDELEKIIVRDYFPEVPRLKVGF